MGFESNLALHCHNFAQVKKKKLTKPMERLCSKEFLLISDQLSVYFGIFGNNTSFLEEPTTIVSSIHSYLNLNESAGLLRLKIAAEILDDPSGRSAILLVLSRLEDDRTNRRPLKRKNR